MSLPCKSIFTKGPYLENYFSCYKKKKKKNFSKEDKSFFFASSVGSHQEAPTALSLEYSFLSFICLKFGEKSTTNQL
jgi:hypothetical protein